MRVKVADMVFEHTSIGMLVCDVETAAVHRISGAPAEYVRMVLDGHQPPDDAITDALIEAKVFEVCEGMSRRQMVSAATAVAGLVTLALPNSAAAASTGAAPEPNGGGAGGATTSTSTSTTSTTTTTTTAPLPAAPTSVPLVGRSSVTRKIRVTWSGTPEAFNYRWWVYQTDGGVDVLLGDGIAASASTATTIFTVPAGPVALRVELESITSPPVANQSSFTL